MVCVIGGTSLMNSTIFKKWRTRKIRTPYGTVSLKSHGNLLFLQRHGNPPLPPHRIAHKANIWALKSLGALKIVAVNSVGSLKLSIKPRTFLVPEDFLSLWTTVTFFEEEMKFTVPSLDTDLATRLFELCRSIEMPVRQGGTYIQTLGPRLETRAEIAMLKRFGDIVGMTMASEASLCLECGIPYTSLCSVDNYCHGIARVPLTMDEIHENVSHAVSHIERLICAVQEGAMG